MAVVRRGGMPSAAVALPSRAQSLLCRMHPSDVRMCLCVGPLQGFVLPKNIKMQGIVVGHKSGLIDMLKAFEKHTILPVIDKHFGFDELPDALNYLVSGNHFGKITIDLA